MKISFIGFGAMAKAIAQGLIQEPSYQLSASSPSLTAGINQDGIHTHHNNSLIAQNADVIILAVKPAQMQNVLEEISPCIPESALLISVAAGLPLSCFAQYTHPNQAIIRTMPNTPCAVGMGATPMCANSKTSDAQKHSAGLIFSQIGLIEWVSDEADLDALTALSGSGPAYVFLFIEAMIDAAVALGLDKELAKKFALQTVQGACALAQASDLSVFELKKQVTSPGGTTAAALNVLEPDLNKLLLQAMTAAKKRAVELSI